VTKNSESAQEKRSIPSFFDPKAVGQELKEVAVDYLEVDTQKVTSRWFHGNHDADLFVWSDEKSNVIKQQISFCGNVVEWNVLDGLKTGVVVEEEMGGHQQKASEKILFDLKPQKASVKIALEMLKYICEIDEVKKQKLIQNLVDPKILDDMSQKELFERFNYTVSQGQVKKLFKKVISTIKSIFS